MHAHPLNYARLHRRVARYWIVIGLLAVSMFLALRHGEPTWRRVRLAYHVRQARAAFVECQQVALPGDVVLYADRGSTQRLTPGDTTRFGTGGWSPPPPDVIPRVAKAPREWFNLAAHVRAAASLDRTAGTFSATAAAPYALTQRDEAVLFVGSVRGAPTDPSGPQDIFALTATPHELRVTRTAHQHLASKNKPGELAFMHPKECYLRVVIRRREAEDRLEWFAAQLPAPGVLQVPYRLNGNPGRFTMRLRNFYDCELDATDGWVSATPGGGGFGGWHPIWHTAARDVALLDVMPDWKPVSMSRDSTGLTLHALAFDAETQHVVAVASRDDGARLESWRVSGGDAPRRIFGTQLPKLSLHRWRDWMVSANGRRLVVVTPASAYSYDLPTGRLVATCPIGKKPYGNTPHFGLNESGELLALLSPDGRTRTWWDATSGSRISTQAAAVRPAMHSRRAARVQCVGRRSFYFLSPPHEPVLTVVDSPGAAPRVIGTIQHVGGRAVSPCGRFLAACHHHTDSSSDGVGLAIYDLEQQKMLLEVSETGEPTFGRPFWSGDGCRVAFGTKWHVFVLDLPARTLLRARKPRNIDWEAELALSHDGRRLAVTAPEAHGVWHLTLPETPRPIPTTSSTQNPS